MAGGRPGGPHPRGRRRAAPGDQRLAVRGGQGRHPAGALRPPRGARPAARWPTSTWSAARTSWSSTATRSSSTRPAPCSPAAPQFREDLLVVDLDLRRSTSTRPTRPRASCTSTLSDQPIAPYAAEPAPHAPRLDPVGEVYEALALGLGDYVRKNGFRSVLLGLSGGIDSALVATIAADALGGENVFGISNPSRYSSQHSRDDAEDLAARLGLDYRVIPIEPMVSAFLDNVELSGVAEENLQARVRALVWMGLSNEEGHLVLATATRASCRWATRRIYGDSVGGFAPIKDVPKTLVWELARWRNAEAVRRGETPPIPEATDHQGALGRAAAGAARHRLAARLRRPRRDPRRLRRAGPRPRRAGRGRLRRGGRRQGRRDGRPGGVEAPPVPPGPKISLRRSAATGACRHQPLAGAGLLSRLPPPQSPGWPASPGAHHRDRAARAVRHRPARRPRPRRAACGSTTCRR